MKVLVCGSRLWIDQQSIFQILSQLPPKTIIVHGAAPGVDTIAAYVAGLLKFEVREYDVVHFGPWPAAGPLRNQGMLNAEHPDKNGVYLDKVIAIHFDSNLGKGTRDMVDRATAAQISVIKHILSKKLCRRS